MKKQKQTQLIAIFVLALAVLSMGIGFATYTQQLSIGGTVAVEKNKWSIHFDEKSYKTVDGSQTVTANTITGTNVQFSSTLKKPGDFCAFTIKAVNDGTFNAVLNQLNMSTLTAEQSKYLTYTVNYAGTRYTSSDATLNTALNVGNNADVVVRVEYVAPANSADLPSENVNVNLSLQLVYNQAD